jgi:hypothetical protein
MALFFCAIKTLEPDLIMCYMVIELPQNFLLVVILLQFV